MKRFCLFMIFSFIIPLHAHALGNADAKITVYIQDAYNIPIENADVVVSFRLPKTINTWDGVKNKSVMGKTDSKGIFSASSNTLKKIYISVKKDGYYKSSIYHSFESEEDGKWQPWNLNIDILLRKKVNPIPMKARLFYDVLLPIADRSIGYDLFLGDWVIPYGKGVKSDLIFKLKREYKNRSDYSSTLMIEMARKNDGFEGITNKDIFQQSELRFPHQAYGEKYMEKDITLTTFIKPGNKDKRDCSSSYQHFFFRIRTELDKKGLVKKALYGKLIGPIECILHYTKTGKLRFTYYLNPEFNDRNTEFDPSKNLFKNIEWFEEVHHP